MASGIRLGPVRESVAHRNFGNPISRVPRVPFYTLRLLIVLLFAVIVNSLMTFPENSLVQATVSDAFRAGYQYLSFGAMHFPTSPIRRKTFGYSMIKEKKLKSTCPDRKHKYKSTNHSKPFQFCSLRQQTAMSMITKCYCCYSKSIAANTLYYGSKQICSHYIYYQLLLRQPVYCCCDKYVFFVIQLL